MGAYVEIFRADGSSERFPLEEGEVVLGRSANLKISMPGEPELDLEHMLLIDRGKAGCWAASAEGVVNPVMRGGKRFSAGMVPWGTEFMIGSLRIVVAMDSRRGGFKLDVDPKLIVTVVVILGGAFAWMQLQASHAARRARPKVEAPALFEEGEVPCAEGDAAANARQAEHMAASWAERYAFDPSDGVRAVKKYREAASCNRQAGDPAQAERLMRRSTQLQERIQHDYRSSLNRLPRWLTSQRWEDALVESQRLIALTKYVDQDDKYVQWIKLKQRETIAKVARKAP